MKPCEYHKIFSSIQPDTVKMSSEVPTTEMDALEEYIAENSDIMEKVYVDDKPFIHFKNGLVYGKDIYVCDMRNNLRSLVESSVVMKQKKYKLPEYLSRAGYNYGTKIPEVEVPTTKSVSEEPVTETKSVKLGKNKYKPMSLKQLQNAADRLMKNKDVNVVRFGETLKDSANDGFTDVMKYLSNVNLILFIGGESLATCMPYIVSSILIIKQDNPEMKVIPELKKQRSIIKSKLKPKDDNLRLYTEFLNQVINDELKYTRESVEIPEEFYSLFESDDIDDDDKEKDDDKDDSDDDKDEEKDGDKEEDDDMDDDEDDKHDDDDKDDHDDEDKDHDSDDDDDSDDMDDNDDNRESVTEAKKKDEDEEQDDPDDENTDKENDDGPDDEEGREEEKEENKEPEEEEPKEEEETEDEPYNEEFGDEGHTDYTKEAEEDEPMPDEEEEPVEEKKPKPLRKIRYSEDFGKNGPRDYTQDIEDDEPEEEEPTDEEPQDTETDNNTQEDNQPEEEPKEEEPPTEEPTEEEPEEYTEDFGEDGPTDYTQDVEDEPEEEPQDNPEETPDNTNTQPEEPNQNNDTQPQETDNNQQANTPDNNTNQDNANDTNNQPQEDNNLDNNEETQQDDNGLEDGPTDYNNQAGLDADGTATDDGGDTTGDTNEEGGDTGADATADPNGETPATNSGGTDRDTAIKNYNIRVKFKKLVESISEILQNLSIVMYHNPIQNQVLGRGIENIQSIKEQIISYMEFNLSSDYKTNLYYYTTFIQALQLNLDMLTKNSQMSMEDTKNNK